MIQTEYLCGKPEDRAAIIDLANYVFSQAHVPHDFKALLPKVYADEAAGLGCEAWHFLAKQDGQIRALVACKPLQLHVGENVLSCGEVGTVSVHPYARGEGHMKKLMAMMLDDAREKRYDLLILGGQRQRYNYFGFEHAGHVMSCLTTAANVRHALAGVDASSITFSPLNEERREEVDYAWELSNRMVVYGERPRDEYLAILRSWKAEARLIRYHGDMAGYIVGDVNELVLEDESLLPQVIKALFEQPGGREELHLNVAPYETERLRFMSTLCSGFKIDKVEMISVYNWKNVLAALLALKAKYTRLQDGEACVRVDGQTVTLRVQGGVPSVVEGGESPIELEHLQAERLFFAIDQLVLPDSRFNNWLPLPFNISSVDAF